jgi:dTDP-4-dehydrorhamnose reductase
VSRILITGGSSYLGRHLAPLAADGHDICYTFYQNDPLNMPQGQKLDVRDEAAVLDVARAFRPQVIIHTVGSNRSADMEAVIRLGASHIIRAAALTQARLIHLSSDSVFDGRNAPYTESAPVRPSHAYGRAKVAAEDIVREYPNHVIIRTSLIYGLQLMDHGTAWIAEALRSGQPVKLFSNQRRNPVWVETLSRACLEMISNDYVGVINVAGRQVMSRAEFGLRMLDWWGIAERDSLTIGPSAGDKWPLDCELDLSRASAVLTTPLVGVDEVLMAREEQKRSSRAMA